jgi:hypothetical protein
MNYLWIFPGFCNFQKYGVKFRGLLDGMVRAWQVFWYRALYSRFTGHKNRGSVRHALSTLFVYSVATFYTVWIYNLWLASDCYRSDRAGAEINRMQCNGIIGIRLSRFGAYMQRCLVSRFRRGIAYQRELLTARLTSTWCVSTRGYVWKASMCLNPRWEDYTVLSLREVLTYIRKTEILDQSFENWNIGSIICTLILT